jgi:hypothetical protein
MMYIMMQVANYTATQSDTYHRIVVVLFQSKMMDILQGESEGIVRREAAALIKEIYEHHKFL